MGEIGAVNVHGVTADDIGVGWVGKPDDNHGVAVSVSTGRSINAEVNLFFDDRDTAAEFALDVARKVAALPEAATQRHDCRSHLAEVAG